MGYNALSASCVVASKCDAAVAGLFGGLALLVFGLALLIGAFVSRYASGRGRSAATPRLVKGNSDLPPLDRRRSYPPTQAIRGR